MGRIVGRVKGACFYLAVAAVIFLSGCSIPKEAIKAEVEAAVLSPKFVTRVSREVTKNMNVSSGDQTGKLNIGSINMDGSTGYIGLVLAALVIYFLWRRGRKAMKTVDMLIGEIDEQKVTEMSKERLRGKALSRGIEKFVRKRLKKVRRKVRKNV